MQLLRITPDTKLSDVTRLVGARNVETLLHVNDVPRGPNVGKAFVDTCNRKIDEADEVNPERKLAILNTLTQDSDIFEATALASQSGWKLFSYANTLPGYMRVPDSITVPDSSNVLGNHIPVPSDVYSKAIAAVERAPHTVSPAIFNEYSSAKHANIVEVPGRYTSGNDPMQWFRIPWGEVTLFSSLSGERIDFPVFPEEVSNGVKANYTQMPDLLYQYEPWQIYNSSGPRTQSFTFNFHRDMWTGDHRDGRANDLIRACMANCYPQYKGSAVYSSIVTLYFSGHPLISGIMTDVTVDWDGPIGQDGWYLHCKLVITITEVAQEPLDFESVRRKPLIG